MVYRHALVPRDLTCNKNLQLYIFKMSEVWVTFDEYIFKKEKMPPSSIVF